MERDIREIDAEFDDAASSPASLSQLPIGALISAAHAQGISLWIGEGAVQYKAPQAGVGGAAFQALKQRKQEIYQALLAETQKIAPQPEARPPVGVTTVDFSGTAEAGVLSIAQLGAWEAVSADPEYLNLCIKMQCVGPLRETVLEMALTDLIERQAILRSGFHLCDGVPRQKILDKYVLKLDRVDLTSISKTDHRSRTADIVSAMKAEQFDLEAGGLISFKLIKYSPYYRILIACFHPLVFSLECQRIVVTEINALYHRRARGLGDGLRPLSSQYADWAAMEQRSHKAGGSTSGSFWEGRLAEIEPRKAPPECAGADSRPDMHQYPFPPDLALQVGGLGRLSGESTPAVLLAGLAAILSEGLERRTVLLGLDVDPRPAGADRMIGPFIRVRPLLIPVAEGLSFSDLIAVSRRAYLEALDLRFPVRGSLAERFQLEDIIVSFSKLETLSPGGPVADGGLGAPQATGPFSLIGSAPDVPSGLINRLSLRFIETPLDLRGTTIADSSSYPADYAVRLSTRLLGLLKVACLDPSRPLAEIVSLVP